MADLVTYVDPAAAGTGDGSSWTNAYTSLASCIAAKASDLVGNGNTQTIYVRSSAGTADTLANVNGFTTDATHWVKVISADNHGGKWNTAKYRIEANSGTTALQVNDDYVTVTGVQVQNSGASARRVCATANTGVTFDKCIFRADNPYTSAVGLSFTGTGTTSYARNCLIYGYGTDGLLDGCLTDNGTSYLYNITVCDVRDDGFSASADGTVIVKNCVVFGAAGTCYDNAVRMTATYCGYSSGADPGTNGINLSAIAGTDLFTDYNNDDFHTKSAICALYGAGDDLHLDATMPFNDDIDGDTRSQWDIGCDEYVAVASGKPYYYFANQ